MSAQQAMKTTTIDGGNGFKFLVLLVKEGDRYGLNDCLTHDEKDPLVEFYDTRYPHTKHGQFVSRYYRSTLLGEDDFGSEDLSECGLALYGGEDDWSVEPAGMKKVISWLRKDRKRK